MSYRKGFLLIIIVLFMTVELACSIGPVLNSPRGYIYIDGIPVEECPEGTHEYLGRELGPTWSQKTCKEPESRDLGGIADLSRCDCDEPTVLDETTNKCVKLVDCPPQQCDRSFVE